jgi:hypothetical protein
MGRTYYSRSLTSRRGPAVLRVRKVWTIAAALLANAFTWVPADSKQVDSDDSRGSMANIGADVHGGFGTALSAYFSEENGTGSSHRERIRAESERKAGPDKPSHGGQQVPKAARPVPINGRIVDTDGRPVRGATARVALVMKAKGGDLSPWIDAVRQRRLRGAGNYLVSSPTAISADTHIMATTDADGHFRFQQFAAEQIVAIIIQAPKIASTTLIVTTRLMEPVAAPGFEIYGANFVATVLPTRPLTGLVRDGKNLQPLAGVEIRTFQPSRFVWQSAEDFRAKTDAYGRFQLLRLPVNWQGELIVSPTADQPYFKELVEVMDALSVPEGKAPIPLEIGLHRSLWIEGNVSEVGSGRPAAGVRLRYLPLAENPYAQGLQGFFAFPNGRVLHDAYANVGDQERFQTQADGSFRIVGLRGRGLVSVLLSDEPYVQEGFGGFDASGHLKTYPTSSLSPMLLPPVGMFPTPTKEINPPQNADSISVNFEVTRGASVRIRAIDPEGKTVCGAQVRFVMFYERVCVLHQLAAEFEVPALRQQEDRLILIHHDGRGIGKAVRVRAGDDRNGPVIVTLEPMATIVGRVGEHDGKFGVAITIRASAFHNPLLSLDSVATDKEGKYSIPHVPVGCQFEISADDEIVDASGNAAIWRFADAPRPVGVNPGGTTEAGKIQFDVDPDVRLE